MVQVRSNLSIKFSLKVGVNPSKCRMSGEELKGSETGDNTFSIERCRLIL